MISIINNLNRMIGTTLEKSTRPERHSKRLKRHDQKTEKTKPIMRSLMHVSGLSENSYYFFSLSASLATRLNAEFVILHVVEELQVYYEGIAVTIFGEDKWREIVYKHTNGGMADDEGQSREALVMSSVIRGFREWFEAECPEFKRIPIIEVVRSGSLMEEIVSQSKAYQCDLITMGLDDQSGSFGQSNRLSIKKIANQCGVPVMISPLAPTTS